MYSVTRSFGLNGLSGFAVAVEADISGGLPAFSIVGLPDSAVRESADRVRAAIKNLGFKFPDRRITINLAPADVRKTGPVYDLPLLLAVLTASGQLEDVPADAAFLGELALDGTLRPVSGVLPMALAVCGIICSIIGSFLVKTKEDATQKSLLTSLRTGTYTAAILSAIVAAPLCYFILGPENNCWGIFIAILCGLIGGTLIGYFTEYFTSDNYKPTKKLAAASETGAATIIIGGISLGLMSTIASILIVAVAILISYFAAGGTTSILDEMGGFSLSFNQGLYGIGIAGVGMLSTLGITLATDAYGPVADNAGGIAEMSELPPEVREITDKLDSVGNTTAAIGKGFAIGSAALTALALFSAYAHTVNLTTIDLLNPVTLVGLFIGATLPFVFGAMTMESVGKAAYEMIEEVRRQFREIPGLLEGKAKADYRKCVDISTAAALHEMILPGVLAIVAPLLIGFLFGTEALGGMIGGSLAAGVLVAILMANAGGAWDNAKKYIESGVHGGKGSEAHKAAVTGDTVGDPFKDTSGPAMNILIKLMTIVSLVFAPVLAAHGGILLNFFK